MMIKMKLITCSVCKAFICQIFSADCLLLCDTHEQSWLVERQIKKMKGEEVH